jgi:hypothetical protein
MYGWKMGRRMDLDILLCLFCFGCPGLAVLIWLSCFGVPLPFLLFRHSCSGAPVQVLLFRCSCSGAPVQVLLFVVDILSTLSFPGCHVPFARFVLSLLLLAVSF